MLNPVQIMEAAQTSAALAKDLRGQWSQFEKEFFEAIKLISVFPVVAHLEVGDNRYCFLVDYQNQSLKEVDERIAICDLASMPRLGNMIANNGKQENSDGDRPSTQ